MSLTHDQLEALKAANYDKSRAWEAAIFTDGDQVLSHGWTVTRTDNSWTCNKTGTEYTTLSRWIRHKLGRRSFNVKSSTYLRDGTFFHPAGLLPPYTERMNYLEFNPASRVSMTFRDDIVAAQKPQS